MMQPSSETVLWLVFQCTGENAFEFQGVFSSEDRAVAACLTDLYCVCPARLDESHPHETGPWPGAWYPHLEARPPQSLVTPPAAADGSSGPVCPHGHDLGKELCGFCRYESRPRCSHGNHSFCGHCGPLPNAPGSATEGRP